MCAVCGNSCRHRKLANRSRIPCVIQELRAGHFSKVKEAQKVRTIIIDDFNEAFKSVDVIIAPTSPSTALPVGSSKNHSMFGEMADILVEPSSIAVLHKFAAKILDILYSGENIAKIKRIIESELCITYGLYETEFDSEKLTNGILTWWSGQ